MSKRFIVIAVLAGILLPAISFSQGETKNRQISLSRHELGIDAAELMPLFRRKDVSYLLNYKWHYSKHGALRLGANLDWGTADDQLIEMAFRIGWDREKVLDKRWSVFYGVDVSIAHTGYNDRTNTIQRWGLSPLFGFRYQVHKHFSISTEPKLNMFRYVYNDPDSFSLVKTTSENQIGIGSIGLILVNFHF